MYPVSVGLANLGRSCVERLGGTGVTGVPRGRPARYLFCLY
jgi:hypothetical protein